MKTVYALIREPFYLSYENTVMLFDRKQDRDNKLNDLIKDAKANNYSVRNNYGDGTSYQFEYQGNDPNIRYGYFNTYNWTVVELQLN